MRPRTTQMSCYFVHPNFFSLFLFLNEVNNTKAIVSEVRKKTLPLGDTNYQ